MSIFSPGGEWFWVMLQFVAVTITLLLILRQIKYQRYAHLVNSLDVLDRKWKSRMMLQARRLTCENYSPDRQEVDLAASLVCAFFEELAVYHNRKIIDLETIWEFYSYYVEHYWIIVKNGILTMRKDLQDPTYYDKFEQLYNELRALNKKKGIPSDEKTSDLVHRFVKIEFQNIQFLKEVADQEEPHAKEGA